MKPHIQIIRWSPVWWNQVWGCSGYVGRTPYEAWQEWKVGAYELKTCRIALAQAREDHKSIAAAAEAYQKEALKAREQCDNLRKDLADARRMYGLSLLKVGDG